MFVTFYLPFSVTLQDTASTQTLGLQSEDLLIDTPVDGMYDANLSTLSFIWAPHGNAGAP